MPKAIWKGVTVAESNATKTVEGNHYFPPDSIHCEHFRESDAHTICGWKGTASYYDLVVDGEVNEQAAWYYPDPKQQAAEIKDYIAFWKGCEHWIPSQPVYSGQRQTEGVEDAKRRLNRQ